MFSFDSIKDYQSLLLNGQTNCVEAVSFYLQQIRKNSFLNAFLEVYDEEALSRAAMLDAKRKAGENIGKLHGVIVGLKDVISFKDHKVSAGSKMLENFYAVFNATIVDKLLQEDALIIGRQNCDEFAMGSSNENSAFGCVLNAVDNSCVPGGSSGGSAVSVQADLCMISLGSDTGGSVRQPADFCGIVGLKPSYGCISRHGLIAYASSFDQIGILAKSIDDAALMLEVISGKDEYDSTVINNPFVYSEADKKNDYKVTYFSSMLDHASLDPEIAQTHNKFINRLTNYGIKTQSIDFKLLEYIVPTYYILTAAEASSNLSRYDGIRFGYNNMNKVDKLEEYIKHNRSYGLGKEVKRRIMLGTFVLSEGYYEAYVTKAQEVRGILLQQMQSIFLQADAIILPASPTTAFTFGKNLDPIQMFLLDIYTVLANLTGIPAIALPLFKHSNGMPFGIQVMTSHQNELTLLDLSKKLVEINRK